MLIFKTCIHLLHRMYTMDGMFHVLFIKILYMFPRLSSKYGCWIHHNVYNGWDRPCAVSLSYNTVRFQSTLWMSWTYCMPRYCLPVYVQYLNKFDNNGGKWWTRDTKWVFNIILAKKQWYYTLLRNYVKTCDKQVLQQDWRLKYDFDWHLMAVWKLAPITTCTFY